MVRVKQVDHKQKDKRAPMFGKSMKKKKSKTDRPRSEESSNVPASLQGAARRKGRSGAKQRLEIRQQQGLQGTKFATRTAHFKKEMRALVRSSEPWEEGPFMVNGKVHYKYKGEGLGKKDIKWSKEAVGALRTATEDMITEWFAMANDMACVNGKTIQPEHAEMAWKMMQPGYISGRGQKPSADNIIFGTGFDSRMSLRERLAEQLADTPDEVLGWVWWKYKAGSKNAAMEPSKRLSKEERNKIEDKLSRMASLRVIENAIKDKLDTDRRWYRPQEIKSGSRKGLTEYVLRTKSKKKRGKDVDVPMAAPPQLEDPGREKLRDGVADLIKRLRLAWSVQQEPRLFTERKILEALGVKEGNEAEEGDKANRVKRSRESMNDNLAKYEAKCKKKRKSGDAAPKAEVKVVEITSIGHETETVNKPQEASDSDTDGEGN